MSETTFRCHKCRILFDVSLPERHLLPVKGKAWYEPEGHVFTFDGKTQGSCPNCKSESVKPVPLEYLEELRVARLKPDTALRKPIGA